ncbi:MAG: DUF3333 domain-containing protein, partial [Pseudomonadota bacterium]
MTATIDFTELSSKHTSDLSKHRLRQRYWAEVRLKAYGMIAIGFAGAALLLLLSTIVTKTTAVVYEYYVTLETTIELSDRDQERLADPNLRINLRRAVGTALQETVPGEVTRGQMRRLTGLVSSEAGLDLGDIVTADPSLIGQRHTFDALLDDNTQLYLKGAFGLPEPISSGGTLTLTPYVPEAPEGSDVTPEPEEGVFVASVGTAALTEIFEALREQRTRDAQRFRAEQARQQNAVEIYEERLLEVETDEARAEIEALLERARLAREAAERQGDILMEKATLVREATFTMTPNDPSLFLKAEGGWMKAREVERERAIVEMVKPVPGREYAEGEWEAVMMERPEATRLFNDMQIVWTEGFRDRGLIVQQFNTRILDASDSASAELAGIWGALVGSFWTMIVTFLLAFPLGVMAS